MYEPPSSNSSPSPSVIASRRWNASRRRLTLFIPRDISEGVEQAEMRAIAYKAIYEYLKAVDSSEADSEADSEAGTTGADPDAS